MSYLIIFIISAMSAWLFVVLPVKRRVTVMQRFMTDSLAVLQSTAWTDDQKQKQLLAFSGRILWSSLLLALLLGVTVLPFLFLIVTENYFGATDAVSTRLLTWPGLGICVLGFVSCCLAKKAYERARL